MNRLFLEDGRFIDLGLPLDISIPLQFNSKNVRAWYVDPPVSEPVRTAQYTGSVAEGGAVNFRNVFFNPHGHGTHTECLGHITKHLYSINDVLEKYFFRAQVISILPKRRTNGSQIDFVITAEQLLQQNLYTEALIIRTLPNEVSKRQRNYSSTNPPYFEAECADILIQNGVKHLLVDLPSVDREEDNGVLAFHHRFWEVPDRPNFERTITELVFVKNEIQDGEYVLNLQLAPFVNDASPSRPVLYAIQDPTK
jgi:arylformamidase